MHFRALRGIAVTLRWAGRIPPLSCGFTPAGNAIGGWAICACGGQADHEPGRGIAGGWGMVAGQAVSSEAGTAPAPPLSRDEVHARFAAALRDGMAATALRQRELANRVGVSPGRISQYLNDPKKMPARWGADRRAPRRGRGAGRGVLRALRLVLGRPPRPLSRRGRRSPCSPGRRRGPRAGGLRLHHRGRRPRQRRRHRGRPG